MIGTLPDTATSKDIVSYIAEYYTETEINTKLGAKLGAVSANGYYGMARPDGNTSDWIRTTTTGIIPYQSGGAGAGHCGLGTSSWYFSNAYIDTVNCVNASVSGHIDVWVIKVMQ